MTTTLVAFGFGAGLDEVVTGAGAADSAGDGSVDEGAAEGDSDGVDSAGVDSAGVDGAGASDVAVVLLGVSARAGSALASPRVRRTTASAARAAITTVARAGSARFQFFMTIQGYVEYVSDHVIGAPAAFSTRTDPDG